MSEREQTSEKKEEGWFGSLMPSPDSPEFAVMLPMIERIKQAGESTRRMRELQFDSLGPIHGSVVFLGDSITEGGLWSEWFPGVRVSNRGIGGDTIAGVADRLHSALDSPSLGSLLIGTNDVSSWVDGGDIDEIAQSLTELVRDVRLAAPSAVLLINAVMPRTVELANRIRRVNERCREIASDNDAVFVDTWAALAELDGSIRPDCSLDALHLTGEGYRRWVEVLRPHIVGAAEDMIALDETTLEPTS